MTAYWYWLRWLVVAGAAAGAAVWWWHGPEGPAQRLAAWVLTVAAAGGGVWQLRARAERRWRTALDAYAERAIVAHEQRRLSGPRGSRVA